MWDLLLLSLSSIFTYSYVKESNEIVIEKWCSGKASCGQIRRGCAYILEFLHTF